MREYESVIIVKSNVSKSVLDMLTTNIENKIKEYGEITKKEDLGIKKLAYEVKKNKEGHYYVYQFKIDEDKSQKAIQGIEKLYRILDEVLKFIIVQM